MTAYKEILQPGDLVRFRTTNGKLYGEQEGGELVYAGYTSLGTTTFLVLETVDGSGRNIKIRETNLFNGEAIETLQILRKGEA